MLPKIVFLDRSTLAVPLRPVGVPHAWVEYPLTAPDETGERLQDATVVITNKTLIDEAVLRQTPSLKLVAVSATGYNNVDVAACKARGITVCNVRDYALTGVTEHTLMLMLALRRQLLAYRTRLMAGDWQKSASFCLSEPPLHDLAGSTLVIIGGGALGKSVAAACGALGMRVLFAEHKGAGVVRPGYVPFADALAQADVVSLHCPLTPETRHLIGAPELAQMKRSALLINTARGGIVDEPALLTALQSGQIAGAGVDVLSEEPPVNGNPLLNVDLPNLIVTPHVAWASEETVHKLAEQLIGNVEAFLSGTPRNIVV
ncbi:D-2-hydroxyacid dehydrogenase [Propionivibrio limicola]|uniref:D-2-hydroxyacid dehydrogenase n=1 Tax=Propionivibrio limicola TaxID=167645 RepID=UPI001292A0A8|nr:D-2-hydroxyacid dehydrogenase [Propionivibrio limicola]